MTRQTITLQRGESRLLRAAAGSRWRTLHGLADCAIEFDLPASAWARWTMRWRIIRSTRAWRAAA